MVDLANGYELTLPPAWFRFELNDTTRALMRATLGSDPFIADLCRDPLPAAEEACIEQEVALFEEQYELFLDSVAMFAVDGGDIFSSSATTVMVYRDPVGGMMPLRVVQTRPTELRDLGEAVNIDAEVVDLPAGQAARVSYEVRGARPRTVVHEYVIPADDDLYGVTVSGPLRDSARVQAAAVQLVESFSILPN